MEYEKKSIYTAGCLFEYGNLNDSSITKFSFDEALRTCNEKSFTNVSTRACHILRKLLDNFSNSELIEKSSVHFYRDYYASNRSELKNKVVNEFSSTFIILYREWESINENTNT